jgi:chromosome segregation ATPase
MGSGTILGLTLGEIAAVLFTMGGGFCTVVISAVVLSFKFQGKFDLERTKTSGADEKLSTKIDTDIGKVKAELEKKIEADGNSLRADLKSLQDKLDSLPEKMRGEIKQSTDPVAKGIDELKGMFHAMKEENRDRFMEATTIKEGFKAVGEQMAGLDVRVLNAEATVRSTERNIDDNMKVMATISSSLSRIERGLEAKPSAPANRRST